MMSLHTLAIVAAATTFCATGYAQTPIDNDSQNPDAATTEDMPMPMGDPDGQMARMDEQMEAMEAIHDKIMEAKTPEERSALIAEQMKVMQDSMVMMGGMGPGNMMGGMHPGGMGGMRTMQNQDPLDGCTGVQNQMMEKQRQMMQSMMQMMMDSMPSVSSKS